MNLIDEFDQIHLGSESIALDAAIYKGFKSLKKLRQEEYFETWMIRFLINKCKKELRRKKRELPLDTLHLLKLKKVYPICKILWHRNKKKSIYLIQ